VVFPDGEVREKGRASANPPELVWRGGPEQLAEEHRGITVAAPSPQRKPTPSDTREKKSGLATGERKAANRQTMEVVRELVELPCSGCPLR
jgi:hypothetical protein